MTESVSDNPQALKPLGEAEVQELAESYDHHNPEFSQDPYPVYEALRGRGRIVHSDHYGGFYAPTRFTEMREIWQNWKDFSTSPSVALPEAFGKDRPMLPMEVDPPLHARYRKALAPALSERRISGLEDKARQLINALVDEVQDRGECDFSASISSRFPTKMFIELYGLPTEESEQFIKWSDDVHHSHVVDPSLETAMGAGAAAYERLTRLVDERRADPQDDLLSALLTEPVGEDMLTDEEAIDISFMMFAAGLDTVTGTMAWQAYYLATHPDNQQRLRSEPEIIPQAVEELLRWEGLINTRRTATRDVEIDGQVIPKGCPVLLSARMANHDPEVFPDPQTVDFDRPNASKHLTFGSGVHRCIGLALARLELRVFHQEWHRRIPEYRLRDGTELRAWGGNVASISTELPLEW